MNNTSQFSDKEKKTLNSMFLRSHLVFQSFNMVKMEANGFTITMQPAIEELYKDDPEGKKDAYLRHQNFFNTHAIPFSFIAGTTYAMEREYVQTNKIDTKSIDNIKASLMGPTAGMFDSIFFNLIRVVAAGIAIGLASQGSIIGPILFVLIYGLSQSVLKFYLVRIGYKLGITAIDSLFKSGLLHALTKASSVLALIMVGAMTAQMVNVPLNWTLNVGETNVVVNDIINQIFPGLLSIILMILLVKLIYKGVRPTILVLGIICISLLLAALGIF